MHPFNTDHVRRDYRSPARNYSSSVNVGTLRMSTGATDKQVSRFPVPLFGVPAHVALPRRIPWVDVADGQTRAQSFIGNLALQVAESPRAQPASLFPASPDPFVDSLEILEGNSSPGAFGYGDNLLRYAVIDMSREPVLPITTLLKQALCGFGPFLLEFTSDSRCPSSQVVEVATRKIISIACCCNVYDPEINTKPVGDFARVANRKFDANMQVEFARTKHKQRLSPIESEKRTLLRAAQEGDSLPTRYGPDAHAFVVGYPGKHVAIVSKRSGRSKRGDIFSSRPVGIGNLSNSSDNDLGGEVGEFLTGSVVSEFMKRKPAKCSRFPRLLRNPITSRMGSAKRPLEIGGLFTTGDKLDLSNELHFLNVMPSSLAAMSQRRTI